MTNYTHIVGLCVLAAPEICIVFAKESFRVLFTNWDYNFEVKSLDKRIKFVITNRAIRKYEWMRKKRNEKCESDRATKQNGANETGDEERKEEERDGATQMK